MQRWVDERRGGTVSLVPDRSFLARLTPDERRALEAGGRHRQFRVGQMLFCEGDHGHDVYVVLEGIIKVVTTAPSGQQVILDLQTSGSLLGELSAIDGQPRSASAEALTSIEVLVLPIDDFRHFLQCQPRAATELLEVVAARLRASSRRQLEFGSSDALTRLCRCLLAMVDRFGQIGDRDARPKVQLPLGQQDLAKLTGLSREAVVKGLRRLRELEWIETQGRTIAILNLAEVEARATS